MSYFNAVKLAKHDNMFCVVSFKSRKRRDSWVQQNKAINISPFQADTLIDWDNTYHIHECWLPEQYNEETNRWEYEE